MNIQKPLPGMNPEETERQLHYMNAVIMFKMMHSRGIINEKELQLCKEDRERERTSDRYDYATGASKRWFESSHSDQFSLRLIQNESALIFLYFFACYQHFCLYKTL